MHFIANVIDMHFIANVIDMHFVSNVIGVLVGIYIFKIGQRVVEVVMAKRK
jgi:hypothetical protein